MGLPKSSNQNEPRVSCSGKEAAAISFACALGRRDTMRMQPDTRYTKAGEVKIAYQGLGDGR